ncbi:hypothetical protein Golax_020157 [Gossypium laxum]|uniref:Agenet domain-containing protein n=1 Tax=Gossypium laxum TaxID=34288 RepID=A0A7J8Z999_9ROSI|nr:hypothetical protein [Gossypium laxum]
MSHKGKAIDAPPTEDLEYLQPGSVVEVSHENNDCLRVWYTATIIERRATSTNDERYVVQFTDIYQDTNSGTKLFLEYNSVDIRPLPPPLPPRNFKAGDIVEAYYQNGWYEGEITLMLDNYNCMFQISSRFLLFGVNQLRHHRTWFNGDWIPPLNLNVTKSIWDEDLTDRMMEIDSNQLEWETDSGSAETSTAGTGNILEESDQKTKEEEFSEGERVEVANIDEDGFNQAWLAATIVKPVENNRYIIRYETLRTGNDTGFLVKEMDSLHIRPPPPDIPVPHQFKMFDNVDALYKGGWWKGIITRVLPRGSRYKVHLDNNGKVMEFKHSDLRLHLDWIDRKWTKPSPGVHL